LNLLVMYMGKNPLLEGLPRLSPLVVPKIQEHPQKKGSFSKVQTWHKFHNVLGGHGPKCNNSFAKKRHFSIWGLG
jgi:hypothetical protein